MSNVKSSTPALFDRAMTLKYQLSEIDRLKCVLNTVSFRILGKHLPNSNGFIIVRFCRGLWSFVEVSWGFAGVL